MNICQESNKNQSCRRKNCRDSLLSTFMMKGIRLGKNTSLVGFQLNFNLAQSQILPLSTIYSALSVTLCHLKETKEYIGASVYEDKLEVDLGG